MYSAEIIRAARTWLGVPFRHQGRSRTGVDCVGFLLAMMAEVGILPAELEEKPTYGRAPTDDLRAAVARYCYELAEPEAGAIALITWPGDSTPSHLGLLTPENIIHAYARVGRVVEHGYRSRWPKMTDSLWRLPGVEP